jgi:hypothetical protein
MNRPRDGEPDSATPPGDAGILMTDLEDRLRAELDSFAKQADPALIRPLRQPAAGRRSRLHGWLAPAATVAAVLAVIMGAAFAGRVVGHGRGAGPTEGIPGAPRYYSGPVSGLPRFYLVLESGDPFKAIVHSSLTGAPLATTQISGMSGTPIVTGAANGRTFLIEQGHLFYLLRVGPDGRSAQAHRLPVQAGSLDLDSAALSPDGRSVAIAEQSAQYRQVEVRSLDTGATRTWRTRAPGAPWNVSWSADGRQVGFLWEENSHSQPASQRDGYRLLDVSGPGDDLLAATAVASVPLNPGGDIPPAFVTSDGRGFITSTTQIASGADHRVTVISKIIKVSARTGRVQQVLFAASRSGVLNPYGNAGDTSSQGCAVLSLDSAGQHPLVQCFLLGRFNFGTPVRGRLKSLAGLPNTFCIRECRGPRSANAAW